MRILVLSSWFPYPPDNGSRIRAYNLLKQISQCHEISLVSFARDGRGEMVGDLRDFCVSVEVVPWVEYSPRRLRAILGFLSSTPRSVVDTHSATMTQLVSKKLATREFDLVLASEMGTAPYVSNPQAIPAVLDEFQTGVIKEAYERAKKPETRFRNWLTWAKHRHYVASILRSFDACVVASAQEKANVREIAPAYDRVYVIPNGVDMDHYRPGSAVPVRDTLTYTGSLTYSANYDAVAHFLGDIFPHIQADVPGVKFKVTGSTQGVALDNLPLTNHVTFTGYLQDVRPVVARSWACVVPLRAGGGTRLKILEAMGLGTPVVSTSKGAEGLGVTHEADILIADDPADFAAQTVRLLRDPDLRQRLSENGRRLVENKYDWRLIGEQFNQLIESVVDTRRRR